MSQSIIHSSTHADALENPSTAALDDLLDNDKDLPLLADTHLLSRVLLTVIAQQTSTPVKQTIDKLLNGEDPHQTIEAILPKLNHSQRKNLIRACGLFAQVFNIAEDMHHERRRLAHEQDESAAKSSFAHVVDEIKAQGVAQDTLQAQLDNTFVSAVLTAHPTSWAMRRRLRPCLRKISISTLTSFDSIGVPKKRQSLLNSVYQISLVGLCQFTSVADIYEHRNTPGEMKRVVRTADRVVVQYKGKKMEEADVLSLFEHPQNPYTRALLSALPENATGDRLPTVASFMDREVSA